MPTCRTECCVGSARQASTAAAALPMSRSQNTSVFQPPAVRKDKASVKGSGLMRRTFEGGYARVVSRSDIMGSEECYGQPQDAV